MGVVSGADTWDPGQYERFKAERSQPFWDLAELLGDVPPGRRLVDLGSGTGELTAALASRLRSAEALGIDSSAAMLASAAAHAGRAVHFAEGDLAAFSQRG